MSAPKTSYEAAALALLAEGGDRYQAGEVVTLPSGARLRVVSGWAAVRAGRVVCTGRLTEEKDRRSVDTRDASNYRKVVGR